MRFDAGAILEHSRSGMYTYGIWVTVGKVEHLLTSEDCYSTWNKAAEAQAKMLSMLRTMKRLADEWSK